MSILSCRYGEMNKDSGCSLCGVGSGFGLGGIRADSIAAAATQGVIETVSEVINENAPNPSMKMRQTHQ